MAKLELTLNYDMTRLINKAKYMQIKKTFKGKRISKTFIKGYVQNRLSKTKIKNRMTNEIYCKDIN